MTRTKTILVDDEPRGLTSLQKLLEINCPETDVVYLASNAEDAKEKILQLKPQLVFLDIAMPGKTGFDLLREIGQVNFEIIFVTAHNSYAFTCSRFITYDL